MMRKKNIVKIAGLLIVLISFTNCSSTYPPLQTVDSVDVQKYLGKWYELARLPNTFQEDCYCSQAEYSLIDNETLSVINSCREDSLNGEIDKAEGKAFIVDGSNNSKLKVQFFWPFKGDYWIINLDKENYSYAVVGTPSRKYLWILSRTKEIESDLFKQLIADAESKGFDVSKLIISTQSCPD